MMGRIPNVLTPLSILALLLPGSTAAQSAAIEPLVRADPADVATPEAVLEAVYASLVRAPGESFDRDRNLSLLLPHARLIPNPEQTGGEVLIHSPREFWDWVDSNTVIGGPGDRGFAEEQVAVRIERYGDIAHAFSTYEKRFWGEAESLGRGINSIQMIRRQGRWWITSVVWDEETGAGAVPERYLGEPGPSGAGGDPR